jgi:hypothetical protein
VSADEIGAAAFLQRAKGYRRNEVRAYLERNADLREKGFAATPPKRGFSRKWRMVGYDPEAVDRHIKILAREGAASGLRVLPAFPVGTRVARRGWQQYQFDGDWQHVSELPGVRVSLTDSKLRTVRQLTGSRGEVLLTRRFGTISLANGQVLRFDRRAQQVTDPATGDPVLWIRGSNFNGSAGGHVLLPWQRYLVFPVSGTKLGNAVMTAISESGTAMLWFRRIPKHAALIEIVVSPDCQLTAEVLCTIALTAGWLGGYFANGT